MDANVLEKREELLCRAERAIDYLESCHISRAAIMILATHGMLEYMLYSSDGEMPQFPLGQIIEYQGVQVMPVYSIDQDDVLQPVVMYNGKPPRVSVGTVVCDTAHYDNGSMFDNLFVVATVDGSGYPSDFDKYDVRFDTPPIENMKPFDNKKLMDFFNGMRR